LVDATGKSEISVQDYAVAMIDELERPAHVRRRFTVGYPSVMRAPVLPTRQGPAQISSPTRSWLSTP
jgi:hypothetical protein